MFQDEQEAFSRLLADAKADDAESKAKLINLAYLELKEMAHALMAMERPDHTWQPTALLHEAILKLLGPKALETISNRAMFFGAFSQAMRRLLIGHARERNAQRRVGNRQREPLDDVSDYFEKHGIDPIEFADALETLDPRQQMVTSMHFIGGYTQDEIAQHLGISVTTVRADLQRAKADLRLVFAPEH